MISDLNLFRDRITNKIVMPDGVFTMCVVNCTNKDLYMMNVRGDRIEKLKPIEDVVDGEKINLSFIDKAAYGWLISKHFINGLPQRCDGTIKVFAMKQTYVRSSIEGERVIRDFQLIASYNPEKPAWKDANYIPIVETNSIVSFDYDFLEQMLLQFESSAEGVMAMIEGKLTQYDGLVTMLVNCSEHDYYTIVDKQIIPVPNMSSFDWFTHGEDSEFGLNEEYRDEAMQKWKSSIMNEFGLSKNQILEGHDMFVSITASHDYPRRKMNLRNLPKDKTYQKFVYQTKRLLKEENKNEYFRPFFIEGSNTPVFRSKEAAELFIKVFDGKLSLYHGAQQSIRIKRMADYKIDMMRGKYVRKEVSVIKTAKRFVLSSFTDKTFELMFNGVMKFMDFLLGKGGKAAEKASKAAMAGKSFYKMSSKMFAAGLGGAFYNPFANDPGYGMPHRHERVYPINEKAGEEDDFGHFVPRTPYNKFSKVEVGEFTKEMDEEFYKEMIKAAKEGEPIDDEELSEGYYDLNGIPIKGGLVTLIDYKGSFNSDNVRSFRDKRKNNKITFIPDNDLINCSTDGSFDIDYKRLEDFERKATNSKATLKMIDFNKIMQLNYRMYHMANEYRQKYGTKSAKDANPIDFENIRLFKNKFNQLRNERDDIIMDVYPEYAELRRVMQNDITTDDGFSDTKRDPDVCPSFEYVIKSDHPYISPKDFAQATPSYKEIVEEKILNDNGGDERWQSGRLEVEESYEEDQLAQKRMGEKGKGFFRRVFDKIKGFWCSKPMKIVRRVVGLGLIVVGVWKAINKWKDLAEALVF